MKKNALFYILPFHYKSFTYCTDDRKEILTHERTASKTAANQLLLDKLLGSDELDWFQQFTNALHDSGKCNIIMFVSLNCSNENIISITKLMISGMYHVKYSYSSVLITFVTFFGLVKNFGSLQCHMHTGSALHCRRWTFCWSLTGSVELSSIQCGQLHRHQLSPWRVNWFRQLSSTTKSPAPTEPCWLQLSITRKKNRSQPYPTVPSWAQLNPTSWVRFSWVQLRVSPRCWMGFILHYVIIIIPRLLTNMLCECYLRIVWASP